LLAPGHVSEKRRKGKGERMMGKEEKVRESMKYKERERGESHIHGIFITISILQNSIL